MRRFRWRRRPTAPTNVRLEFRFHNGGMLEVPATVHFSHYDRGVAVWRAKPTLVFDRLPEGACGCIELKIDLLPSLTRVEMDVSLVPNK